VNVWFAVAVLVTALVAVLMAGWLSTRISRPVTQMEHRAALGDLARQVNHDIKNALAPLRNVFRHFAQVAEGEPAKLPAVFAKRQGTVDASLGYLETLAANYARLYPPTNERPTDVNAVVRQALGHVAGADHATLRTELPDGLPPVRADALVLRRVIENLLGNAVDSLEGRPGTVTLATERGGDGLVRLSVSDTGSGMTKTELERAFEDFYTTKLGGTGLGLSIVRRLVLDSNGTLRVESEPGKGSTFIVEIPAEKGGPGAS
jgi:signal transduction histidine kinase